MSDAGLEGRNAVKNSSKTENASSPFRSLAATEGGEGAEGEGAEGERGGLGNRHNGGVKNCCNEL